MKTTRRRRQIAIVLSVALLSAACHHGQSQSSSSTTTSKDRASTTSTTPIHWENNPTPPPPPNPIPLPDAGAAGVQRVADAFAGPDSDDRAAMMLTAYRVAGVPVIGVDGASLTANGTVGIPWAVAYVGATTPAPTARIPLSMIGGLFAELGSDPDTQRDTISTTIVEGLRSALGEEPSTSAPAWVARLVQEEALRFNRADLADPTRTPADLYVSGPTFNLLAMAVALAALQDVAPRAGTPGRARPLFHQETTELPLPCSDKEPSEWGQWLLSKIMTGGEIVFADGVVKQWKGLVGEKVLESLGHELGEEVFAHAEGIAVLVTLLFTLDAIMHVTADATTETPGPLVRSHSIADGERKIVDLAVHLDLRENSEAVTCLYSMLGLIGNDALAPEAGPLKDVSVKFGPVSGFQGDADGQIVYFDPQSVGASTYEKVTSDENGVARMGILGKGQDVNLPSTADPVDKTYTVSAAASVEPVNGTALGKMGLDSLFCALGTTFDCPRVVADLLRELHWSLGEFQFLLTDWCGLDKKKYPDFNPCLPDHVKGTIQAHLHSSEVTCERDRPCVTHSDSTEDWTLHLGLVSVRTAMMAPNVSVVFDPTERNTFDVTGTHTYYSDSSPPQPPTVCRGSRSGSLATTDEPIAQLLPGLQLALTQLRSVTDDMKMVWTCEGPDAGRREVGVPSLPLDTYETCAGAPSRPLSGPVEAPVQRNENHVTISYDCSLHVPYLDKTFTGTLTSA